MALKLGNRVTVKPLKAINQDHPLARFSGTRGEVVQIGAGPHLHPGTPDNHEGKPIIRMEEGSAATCPDPTRPILVDSQWVNGVPNGPTGMREWFTEDELDLG